MRMIKNLCAGVWVTFLIMLPARTGHMEKCSWCHFWNPKSERSDHEPPCKTCGASDHPWCRHE
jgi:hypothetical protein